MAHRPKTTPTGHGRHALLASFVLITTLGWTQLVRGDPQHDLLLFLSLEGIDVFSGSDPALEYSDVRPTADILYTFNNNRFRFLGEYIWSDSESELERFKAGWQATDRTVAWFGRFHTISKYWTTEYHHGQYMQTSISRPGLEEWEDEGGPMSSHITGMLLEHEYEGAGESAIGFGFAAGLGSKFIGQELVPLDLLDPQSGHDLAVNYRMTYRPDVFSTSQVGLMVAWNDIPVDSASAPALVDLNAIRQTTIGLFADWQWTDWRVITSWVYFDNELQFINGDENDDFVLAYLQAEYKASENWTIFGRSEFGFGEDDSIYLQLLPTSIAHRHMLGVRWDFTDAQGLALELADTSTQGENFVHDHFKEIRLQWSAVFP